VTELASLLPLIAIFAIFWLLVIRPAQRRQKDMRAVQNQLSVGDRVLTNAGIYGTVARIDDDRIGLEVADGVVLELARGAVVGVQGGAARADADRADADRADVDPADADPADTEPSERGATDEPGDPKGL
jgi:preprotein translocase subunit YajC